MEREKVLSKGNTPSKHPVMEVSPAQAFKLWDKEDRKTIHEISAKGTNYSEFKVFLYQAAKYQLDPLSNEIWAVKYDKAEPASIFTGRDGFLAIAHRSGNFKGMETRVLVKDKDGGVREQMIAVNRADIVGAVCRIYRKDSSDLPVEVAVSMADYNKGRSTWKSMTETMIKKVAESQALRKAFNISGLYSPEEGVSIQHNAKVLSGSLSDASSSETAIKRPSKKKENVKPEPKQQKKKQEEDVMDTEFVDEQGDIAPDAPITKDQIKRIHVIAGKLWSSKEDYKAYLKHYFKANSSKELTYIEAEDLIAELAGLQEEASTEDTRGGDPEANFVDDFSRENKNEVEDEGSEEESRGESLSLNDLTIKEIRNGIYLMGESIGMGDKRVNSWIERKTGTTESQLLKKQWQQLFRAMQELQQKREAQGELNV